MKKIHKARESRQREKLQDFLVMLRIQHGKPEELHSELLAMLEQVDGASKPWWAHTELDREGLARVKQEFERIRQYRVEQGEG